VSPRAGEAVSPREWVRDQPFPWPPTLAQADGDAVTACFSVLQVSTGRTRGDAPFLRLQLGDCYGTLDARMWENVDAVAAHCRPGAYVGVRGQLETYQDQRQLRIDELVPVRVELDDLVLFLPRSARAAAAMDAELAAFIDSVRDEALRRLLLVLLDAATETGHAFRLAPAAKLNHHAYLGGLIEHTLSVTTVCDRLADHYGAVLDRDLLIAAALLHDIGKVREIGARAGFPYTDEGKLLGHLVIGMQMVADAARAVPALPESRLLLLQHLIASHQGRFEWHSPREPRTLEAIVLHYADDLDAKLNQAAALLDAVGGTGWSAYDRGFGRDFLKHLPPPAPETSAVDLPDAAERLDAADPAGAAHPADPLPAPASGTGRAGRQRDGPARPAPRSLEPPAPAERPAPGEPPAPPARPAPPAPPARPAPPEPGEPPARPGPPRPAGPPAPPEARPQDPPGLGTLDLFDSGE
jgi:3'-5' exoribonuclease